MDKKLLKFSPLTESTFYILLSLNSPLHGYGIIKKVEGLTDKRLLLAAGTLYGAIKTLLDNKLIKLISEDKFLQVGRDRYPNVSLCPKGS